tara:strand:- start:401 stop:1501 length:1101 start_codon:yes stop_codon:yes gene_type:complete
MSSPYTKPTLVKSKIRDMFNNNQNIMPSIDTGADGSEQTISTDPTATSSSATVTNDPSGNKPGTSPSGVMGPLSPEQARIKNRRTHEQAFGKDPITQFKEARKGVKIRKSRIRDNFKDKKQEIKKDEYNKAVNQGQISLRKPRLKEARNEKREEMNKYKDSPMNYLNPNTLEVQGDAGQAQAPAPDQQMAPNRAGRPINSNVLMNDPSNYQDPSKVSAQQNNQNQMFSGLAQSAGTQNPEPMIPGQDSNQGITPGQPSPFNINDPKKKFQNKTGFKDLNEQENAIATGDADWKGHKAGHSLNKVKEKYAKKAGSPAKKNWIQDVNKDIEKRGTKGVCTGDKFGSESCPPGSKRYNLAKTFKKMNKK